MAKRLGAEGAPLACATPGLDDSNVWGGRSGVGRVGLSILRGRHIEMIRKEVMNRLGAQLGTRERKRRGGRSHLGERELDAREKTVGLAHAAHVLSEVGCAHLHKQRHKQRHCAQPLAPPLSRAVSLATSLSRRLSGCTPRARSGAWARSVAIARAHAASARDKPETWATAD